MATSSTNYLLPWFSAFIQSSAPRWSFGITSCLFKAQNSSEDLKSNFFLAKKCSEIAASSKMVASHWDTYQRGWEDPDDGSGSDYDEEDEEDEEGEAESDLDYESDGEKEDNTRATAINSYEDDLVKEVELLLEPEEREILQQNPLPSLEKISTEKWKALPAVGLSGQIAFMDKLLEYGVDIDSVDKNGLTALHMAIIAKKEPVISHLLRKGASPHVKDLDGATPLHYAVQVGALQTVKLLIKYKADVNVADNEGWTPLHIALQTRNRHIVKILLVNGADKTRRNKDGKTALDLALCYGKDFKSHDLAKLVRSSQLTQISKLRYLRRA